jgi:hypothetical protein
MNYKKWLEGRDLPQKGVRLNQIYYPKNISNEKSRVMFGTVNDDIMEIITKEKKFYRFS